MLKLVLLITQNAVAALCGAGVLSMAWLLATLAIAYGRSILTESEGVPDGNFSNLGSQEFDKSETNIKLRLFKSVLVSSAFFAFGYGAAVLEWI